MKGLLVLLALVAAACAVAEVDEDAVGEAAYAELRGPKKCQLGRYQGIKEFKEDLTRDIYKNVDYLAGAPSPRMVIYDEDDRVVKRVLLDEETTARELHVLVQEHGIQ
eukprot:TRINITY_DN9153_c0_g1_i1.p2 TRINITY_DN9153_c0_g1~~TRINITY_DN9153_c0_g1_i1.p2  ORF type:complete len:108 (-),score=47.56 TRINITY_DN9153_c0_g1_i1:256-579(-)